MIYEDLKDKKVLITGASLGIGAAAAAMFSQQGSFVGVHYCNSKEPAEKVLAEVKKNSDGVLIQADVCETDDIKKMVKQFVDAAGGIDVLVNNAGSMIERRTLEDTTAEFHDKVYATNVRSIILVSKEALPYLKTSKGNIVNIGSVGGHTGGGSTSEIYCASKGAVATLTIGMAREFAQYGIRVNNICPGLIETPFHEKFSTKEFVEAFAKKTLMGRNGTAQDIAKAILFMASNDAAGFITGEYIAINGGFYMRA
ncbi:MAG: SDR family NAD(P)-dependent oxidoreductase [Planctomycetota bacterium]|jgi:3-oxoacyl-[acyl-carrier protein] reductase